MEWGAAFAFLIGVLFYIAYVNKESKRNGIEHEIKNPFTGCSQDRPYPLLWYKKQMLDQGLVENWKLIHEDEFFKVYWDKNTEVINFYLVDSTNYRLVESSYADNAREAEELVKDWMDDYFNYPCVVFEYDEYEAIWEGEQGVWFKNNISGERYYFGDENRAYQTEDPYSKRYAAEIAEEELPKFIEVKNEIGK